VPKLVSANFSRISHGREASIRVARLRDMTGIPTAANSFVEVTG
jgi:hypothetical protein